MTVLKLHSSRTENQKQQQRPQQEQNQQPEENDNPEAQQQLFRAAIRQVFDHWVYMLNRDPNRCALGPARREVITRALRLYPTLATATELCELAVDGCAASAWHAGANKDGRTYQDLEMILADERRIERFAAQGEKLRADCAAAIAKAARMAAAAAAASQVGDSAAPVPDVQDTEAARAARERIKQFAEQLRRQGAGR